MKGLQSACEKPLTDLTPVLLLIQQELGPKVSCNRLGLSLWLRVATLGRDAAGTV